MKLIALFLCLCMGIFMRDWLKVHPFWSCVLGIFGYSFFYIILRAVSDDKKS